MKIKRTVLLFLSCLAVFASCSENKDVQDTGTYSAGSSDASSSSVTEPDVSASPVTVSVIPAVTEPSPPPAAYKISGVELIWQNPELPTGCEVTSLTMLLNYLGFDISKTELAEKYLAKDYFGKVSLNEAFLGDPAWDGGFGCFAPVIADTASKYLKDQKSTYKPKVISGTSFRDLFCYIAADTPVVVWASMELSDVYRYLCYTTEKGEDQYFYDNEHCMLLIGYDTEKNTVTAADPLDGIVTYGAERFEYIYNELEKQAVIIERS